MEKSSHKPLWSDEIFTAYISGLGQFDRIIHALLTGVDQSPPLFHLITGFSARLCSDIHVGLRIPAIAGFVIFTVCIFLVVRERVGAAPALLAACFPTLTWAYRYAIEARPYGPVLACCGLAVFFWQAAARSNKRMVGYVGVGVSLGLGSCLHYYAILVLVPFAMAEASRRFLRKPLRWQMLLAIALGAAPLAFHLPLIRSGVRAGANFWARPTLYQIVDFFGVLPETRLTVSVVAIGAVSLILWFFHGLPASADWGDPPREPRGEELVLAVGFVMIPAMTYVLARITGAMTLRYSLPAVLGLSLLVGYGASRLSPVVRVVSATIMFSVAFLYVGAGIMTGGWRPGVSMAHQVVTVDSFHKELPPLSIVVADVLVFLPMAFYEDSALRGRTYYLIDREYSLSYLHNEGDLAVSDLAAFAPLRVASYSAFIRSHDSFLVISNSGEREWLPRQLIADHWSLSLLAENDDGILAYRADHPSPRPPSGPR